MYFLKNSTGRGTQYALNESSRDGWTNLWYRLGNGNLAAEIEANCSSLYAELAVIDEQGRQLKLGGKVDFTGHDGKIDTINIETSQGISVFIHSDITILGDMRNLQHSRPSATSYERPMLLSGKYSKTAVLRGGAMSTKMEVSFSIGLGRGNSMDIYKNGIEGAVCDRRGNKYMPQTLYFSAR